MGTAAVKRYEPSFCSASEPKTPSPVCTARSSLMVASPIGTGIVTPPGDGAALADAVASLLDDPDRAAALGVAGRAWVESEASWRRLVGDWLAELDPAATAAPGQSTVRSMGSSGTGGRSS